MHQACLEANLFAWSGHLIEVAYGIICPLFFQVSNSLKETLLRVSVRDSNNFRAAFVPGYSKDGALLFHVECVLD